VASVSEALAQDTGASSLASAVGSPVDQDLDGTWLGGLTDSRGYRTLLLRVSTDADGGLAGTLSWEYRHGVFLAQDASVAVDLPATDFRHDGQQVEFKLPSAKASYAGTLSADGSAIKGIWTQQGSRARPADFMCAAGWSMRGSVVAPIEKLPTLVP
jgi:hypothetical protein